MAVPLEELDDDASYSFDEAAEFTAAELGISVHEAKAMILEAILCGELPTCQDTVH